MKIDVLGTPYKVKLLGDKKFEKYDKDNEYEGFCYAYDKLIIVRTQGRSKKKINSTLRHEVIHAFQNESGVRYAMDNNWDKENETDWLAFQLSKIAQVFTELNI